MDGQLLQTLLVAAILAGAGVYLGRRVLAFLGVRRGKDGCGGGCGCSSNRH